MFAQYPFVSHSDCEVLLPLYTAYKDKMASMLDAEYAFVLYDKLTGQVMAARDPIGIRPMFYGTLKETGKMAFASEAKALHGLCVDVYPFPPGHVYYQGKFADYAKITEVRSALNDLEDIDVKIRKGLSDAVTKRLMSDVPLGYLLSGGLDSSLVCALAQRQTALPIDTFAIGMVKDAIDLKYARQVADFIGSNHHEVTMTMEDVLQALKHVIYHLESYDITTIRASMGMYLLCRYIKENTDIKVLMTGEISDELFGYKYTDFAPDGEEFQKESEKRIRELYLYDVLRADRCIAAWSLEARVPFGDLDFVRDVMAIKPELKMNTKGQGKYLLRKAFEKEGLLPEEILWREKAAFSDAVGHSMVEELKKYAESIYTPEDVKKARLKYPHCPPHTSEALLYREMFEKLYAGRSEMIPGYWMPNADWPGCKVDDPSARVLSNYGGSGK
jgi:asparagine synthase (glutamine-hydrolysing)